MGENDLKMSENGANWPQDWLKIGWKCAQTADESKMAQNGRNRIIFPKIAPKWAKIAKNRWKLHWKGRTSIKMTLKKWSKMVKMVKIWSKFGQKWSKWLKMIEIDRKMTRKMI
jgi:hypothetical protein